jgi:hypothetical protein
MVAAALVLFLAGLWLLTQTVIGGLPERLLSYRGAA